MPETDVSGISFGLATHVGTVRQVNQDSAGACIAPPGSALRGVFVLADGMGGGHAGDEASQLAVSRLIEHFSQWSGDVGREALLCEMKLAVSQINREIYDLSRLRGVREIGTTVDLVIVTHEDFLLAHVGDGRVYQLAETTGHQLTEDHSVLNDLVKRGVPLETALLSVGGNQVTHIVGTGGSVDPRTDPIHMDIVPGQVFALCCDGVHGGMEKSPPACIGPGDLADAVAQCPSLQAAAEAVVICAVERDGSDNATCLLVRIEPPGGQEGYPPGYQSGQTIQLPGDSVGDLSAQPVEQVAAVADSTVVTTQPGGQIAAVSDSPSATSGKIGLPFQSLRGEPKKPFNHLTAAITAAVTIFVGLVIIGIVLAMYWKGAKAPVTPVIRNDPEVVVPPEQDPPDTTKLDQSVYLPLCQKLSTVNLQCGEYKVNDGDVSADNIMSLAALVGELSSLWHDILKNSSSNLDHDRLTRVSALTHALKKPDCKPYESQCIEAVENVYAIVQRRLLLGCLKQNRRGGRKDRGWRFSSVKKKTEEGERSTIYPWSRVRDLLLGLDAYLLSLDLPVPPPNTGKMSKMLDDWEILWDGKLPQGNTAGHTHFMKWASWINQLHHCKVAVGSRYRGLSLELARDLANRANEAEAGLYGRTLAATMLNSDLLTIPKETWRVHELNVRIKSHETKRSSIDSAKAKAVTAQSGKLGDVWRAVKVLWGLKSEGLFPMDQKKADREVKAVTVETEDALVGKLDGYLKKAEGILKGAKPSSDMAKALKELDGVATNVDGVSGILSELSKSKKERLKKRGNEFIHRHENLKQTAGDMRVVLTAAEKVKNIAVNLTANLDKPDSVVGRAALSCKTRFKQEEGKSAAQLKRLKSGRYKDHEIVRHWNKTRSDLGTCADRGAGKRAQKFKMMIESCRAQAKGSFIKTLVALRTQEKECESRCNAIGQLMAVAQSCTPDAIKRLDKSRLEYIEMVDAHKAIISVIDKRASRCATNLRSVWTDSGKPDEGKPATFSEKNLVKTCDMLAKDLGEMRKHLLNAYIEKLQEAVIVRMSLAVPKLNRPWYVRRIRNLIADGGIWTQHNKYLDALAKPNVGFARLAENHKKALARVLRELLKREKAMYETMHKNWIDPNTYEWSIDGKMVAALELKLTTPGGGKPGSTTRSSGKATDNKTKKVVERSKKHRSKK